MNQPAILVAGIGNIFLGDDAFGVEVVKRLGGRLPEGVKVVDFGIRAFDLLYALLDDYDAVILVDAVARGGVPGTLYTIELDQEQSLDTQAVQAGDAHGMNPDRVLEMVRAYGGSPKRLLLVGCQPATLEENEDGEFRLSPAVEEAANAAAVMVENLVSRLIEERQAGVARS